MSKFRFTTTADDLTRPLDAYDDVVALATAENAVACYKEPEEYRRLCQEAGFTDAELFEAGATQVGVSWSPEVIVVAARGSSERGDWRDDFKIWRVGWKGFLPRGVRVSRGFKYQLLRLGEPLRERFLKLRKAHPEARLVVTGHSLGGALTPFIVAWLEQEGLKVDAAYAHEMPRTGNRRWQEWYDSQYGDRTHRVVNVVKGVSDLVTRVPKRWWGYRHLGSLQLLVDGQRFEDPAKWKEYRAANPVGTLEAWRVVTRLVRGVKAHLGENLLDSLHKNAQPPPD